MGRPAIVSFNRKSEPIPEALGRCLLWFHWPEWCHGPPLGAREAGRERALLSSPSGEGQGDDLEMHVRCVWGEPACSVCSWYLVGRAGFLPNFTDEETV